MKPTTAFTARRKYRVGEIIQHVEGETIEADIGDTKYLRNCTLPVILRIIPLGLNSYCLPTDPMISGIQTIEDSAIILFEEDWHQMHTFLSLVTYGINSMMKATAYIEYDGRSSLSIRAMRPIFVGEHPNISRGVISQLYYNYSMYCDSPDHRNVTQTCYCLLSDCMVVPVWMANALGLEVEAEKEQEDPILICLDDAQDSVETPIAFMFDYDARMAQLISFMVHRLVARRCQKYRSEWDTVCETRGISECPDIGDVNTLGIHLLAPQDLSIMYEELPSFAKERFTNDDTLSDQMTLWFAQVFPGDKWIYGLGPTIARWISEMYIPVLEYRSVRYWGPVCKLYAEALHTLFAHEVIPRGCRNAMQIRPYWKDVLLVEKFEILNQLFRCF